jgi:hypothetical protein
MLYNTWSVLPSRTFNPSHYALVIRCPHSSGQVQQGAVETDIQKPVGTDPLKCFDGWHPPSSDTLRCRLCHAHLQLRQLDLGSEVHTDSDKTAVERDTLDRSTE